MHKYPLGLSFKIIAIDPQVVVSDSTGQTVFFIRQKAFALREDVRVYRDESMETLVYQITADRIIDWNAVYTIKNAYDQVLGTVRRQGMKSLWNASYTIFDSNNFELGSVREENPWLKVLDGFLNDIPFLGMLVNPSYVVSVRGHDVLRLKKKPAVFEGKFSVDLLVDIDDREEELLSAATIMVLMLERLRG